MYQCDHCNYESSSKFNVKRHEAKRHKHKQNQDYQQPFQLHQPGVQQHHQHPVHVHQASEPVHARHAQIPMLSNHSQGYVGGTEGQCQFQLKTPQMEGNPHQHWYHSINICNIKLMNYNVKTD